MWNKMADAMHEVNTIKLDLYADKNDVALEVAGTVLGEEGEELTDEYGLEDELVECGRLDAWATAGGDDAGTTTDDEDDDTGVCGGVTSELGKLGETRLELDDGDDALVIFVIVNAGLVFPESP